MDKNKSPKNDKDIAREFERLFNTIPEPTTDDEIFETLQDYGYDPKELRIKGEKFATDLISKNWRFVTSEEIEGKARKISEIPLRVELSKEKLLGAIQKISEALSTKFSQPSLAFRNLDNLTEQDLASILQELEFEASEKNIKIDFS